MIVQNYPNNNYGGFILEKEEYDISYILNGGNLYFDDYFSGVYEGKSKTIIGDWSYTRSYPGDFRKKTTKLSFSNNSIKEKTVENLC